jgi:2-polyprenyl-3-methyl-5-hydroxy-6-metoxy-1,4-benzoquinol methylase
MERTEVSKTASFWNKIARKYAAKPISDEGVYRQKLKHTQSFMNSDMRVLEFGCGTGSTALEHAPHVKQYEAIDFSSEMIEIAKEKQARVNLPNLDFQTLSLEDLEERVEHYDMVLGLSVLHLLDDPAESIAKVHALLKPGALFVSSTACIQDFMPWFSLIGVPLRVLGFIPKVQIFGETYLLSMLRDAGFEIEFRLSREKKKDAIFLIARKI